MDAADERSLLDGLKTGDAAAFDALYDHWRARLFGHLVRMCGRKDVAEDLMQETWLRLVRTAPQLREGTSFGPWLFTVARNLLASYRRSRLLDEERVQELWRLESDGTKAGSPFADAASSELQGHLEEALASLPHKYREAVLLVAVERLSPKEAASVCSLRPDAFRQRLARGRALLDAALDRLREKENRR
ncbi:MAG: RNA polymerase sigma factor [Deltaproteobacteria bacterium]|nr:RNA polymerase sigma factor [Deltaproteobacteria bacterium]